MRRLRRLWLLPISLALIAGGVMLHFARIEQAESSPPPPVAPWALATAPVGRGEVAAVIQSVGVVQAPRSIVLVPQITGSVLAVGPRAGAKVHAGELLVRIDTRAIAATIRALEQQRAAAEATAEYAAREAARNRALVTTSVVSRSVEEQAQATATAATAQVQNLTQQIAAQRVTLGYGDILAPQDATVADRLADVGDTVGPGAPVYRLTAGEGAVVQVSLPAATVATVRVGDTLELSHQGASERLRVSRVAPAVNGAGLGFVEADAPAPPFGLPSGASVDVALYSGGGEPTLTVPPLAVVGEGKAAHVFRFLPGTGKEQAGTLRLVPVTVLRRGGTHVAVAGALTPGELVVVGQTAVLGQLHDGDRAVSLAGGAATE
jgi:RND family efflux transporter MFP subunit